MLLMFCARLATLQVKGTLSIRKRTLLHSSFIGQEYQMSYIGAQAKTNNALQQKICLTCVISSIHASFLSMTLCSGDVNLQFLVIHPLSCKFPVKWIIVGGERCFTETVYYLPLIYSIVPSSTRFSRGSNPFKTPLAIKNHTQKNN